MIHFEKDICQHLDAALGREWLETNGLGGYASSTIIGLDTRRYHGLLVAATRPPVGRLVLLSKLEETLVIGGRRYELSTNQYGGAIHPQGYSLQTGFRLDPFPVYTYRVEDLEIEKSIFMIQDENSTVIRYEILNADDDPSSDKPKSVQLELRPLVAFRDYHSLRHEDAAIQHQLEASDSLVSIKLGDDGPTLYLAHDGAAVLTTGYWYRNFERRAERARGFDYTEDLYNPCALVFDLSERKSVSLIASTERRESARAVEYRLAEIERRHLLAASAPVDVELVRALTLAADQFIVRRGANQTIIAGYHWFSDWGRDTMIALPGLTLACGRADVARGILLEFSRHVDQGMLPNRFPDAGETPEYNTVDATLWYFEAVRALLRYTNDEAFVRDNLYEVLKGIIDWHVRGTRYNIHVDHQGLLASGEEGVQLTWMDAKVADWVVTPRRGLAVEIQALWYNALRVMEQLARCFDDEPASAEYGAMAGRAAESFNQLFWNEAAGCLYDVVDGEVSDASIRPNQVFAISLPYTMLSPERARKVVAVVERDLLTPLGLRSLSPQDASYRPRYEGDSLSRDGAYHQGTVWAWLMGPFISAYLKAYGADEERRARAAGWLQSFQAHLSEAGLGQVSEIFDGEAPHAPNGCIAQAWSVGELLRAAHEDVYPESAFLRNKHETDSHSAQRRTRSP